VSRLRLSVAGGAPRWVGRCFVFSGQGSQWLGMGAQLQETLPEFRVRSTSGRGVGWPASFPSAARWLGDDAELFDNTDFAQPALFAIEVALGGAGCGTGRVPDVVMGHSGWLDHREYVAS